MKKLLIQIIISALTCTAFAQNNPVSSSKIILNAPGYQKTQNPDYWLKGANELDSINNVISTNYTWQQESKLEGKDKDVFNEELNKLGELQFQVMKKVYPYWSLAEDLIKTAKDGTLKVTDGNGKTLTLEEISSILYHTDTAYTEDTKTGEIVQVLIANETSWDEIKRIEMEQKLYYVSPEEGFILKPSKYILFKEIYNDFGESLGLKIVFQINL